MTVLPGPKAILFDLDDTIVAFTVASMALWWELCQRFAPRIEGIEAEQMLKAIDKARNWYWYESDKHRAEHPDLVTARREVVSLAFSDLGIDDTETACHLADTYSTEREEQGTLFPGAIDTLQHFKDRGVRLALVTNGSAEFQRNKIRRFELAPFFDCIIIDEELGASKPDERVFLHALEQLGVSAGEAWMVGDHLEWDIGGAQKVGIYGIWVDWQGKGLPEGATVHPDRIITAISELM